jgi:hypothetical protein
VALLGIIIQVSPDVAQSNFSKWLATVTDHVPLFLKAPSIDWWAFSLLITSAAAILFWPIISRLWQIIARKLSMATPASQLAISYEPRQPWIVRIEKSNIDGQVAPSIWFRVRVDNLQPSKIARDVRVSIVRIEYKNGSNFEETEFATAQILSWSSRATPERFCPSDLIAEEKRFVDVVSVDPVHNVVHIKWPVGIEWIENENIFVRHGTYRLTLTATPFEGRSARIQLLLCWNGNWDQTRLELAHG